MSTVLLFLNAVESSNDALLKILKPRGHTKPSLKARRHSFVLAQVHIWNCKCKFFRDRLAFLISKYRGDI